MQKVCTEQVRRTLSTMLTKTAFCGDRYIITRNRKETAVMISWDDWQWVEQQFKERDKEKEVKE